MNRDLSKWESIKFVCRQCGSRAVMNPDDHREWGCRKCQGATFSVSIHFKPLSEPVPQNN